jgi:ribosome-associated protein
MTDGLLGEIRFRTSRSSGPGGQNVNKSNTKVELHFDVEASRVLGPDQKEKILSKLAKRINASGELHLSCQVHRSQFKNKQECINKFIELIFFAFSEKKKRKPTKVTIASKIKRLNSKRIKAEKKLLRQKV